MHIDIVPRRRMSLIKYVLPSVAAFLLLIIAPVDSCEAGWPEFQDSCYLFGDGHYTFSAYEEYCRQHNSELIRVDNVQEDNFIKQELAKQSETYWWVGITDKANEGVWRFDNGELVTYFSWSHDEPTGGVYENCAVYNRQYGWVDTSCSRNFRPLCERGSDVPTIVPAPSDTCETGWLEFQESCYLFGDGHLTFLEAESYCRQQGTHSDLVRVDNDQENGFIKQELAKQSETYWWVGITDMAKEGVWRFDNGELVTYFDWGQNEPNSWGNEDCVVFNREYGWADTSCSDNRRPLCEMRRSGVPQVVG